MKKKARTSNTVNPFMHGDPSVITKAIADNLNLQNNEGHKMNNEQKKPFCLLSFLALAFWVVMGFLAAFGGAYMVSTAGVDNLKHAAEQAVIMESEK